jgi:regulation of enolase protein 1 (concanavalin A-like superfamily)
MVWINEPPDWDEKGDTITVTAAARTDFWRRTHNGEIHDNGHFYYGELKGDFTAGVTVTGTFTGLYDQAGLMVRLDERTWMKFGIEFVNGMWNVSAVVTRDWSDWSLVPFRDSDSIHLRVKRIGATFEASFAEEGGDFRLFRQAYLTDKPDVLVGVMIASPLGDGCSVEFESFRLNTET